MKREDVVNKRFSRSFIGYDTAEVDAFLDELIQDMDAMYKARELDAVRIKTLIEEVKRRQPQRPETKEDPSWPED